MTTKRKSTKKPIPVLVTTLHKGVFFGYTTDYSGATITLTDARMCLYWDKGGFMSLASVGPDDVCRLGMKADITLRDITSVCAVTPEAEAAWIGR